MEKIILYSEELPHISIHMSMYFNEMGQLIFDGQDLGITCGGILGGFRL